MFCDEQKTILANYDLSFRQQDVFLQREGYVFQMAYIRGKYHCKANSAYQSYAYLEG